MSRASQLIRLSINFATGTIQYQSSPFNRQAIPQTHTHTHSVRPPVKHIIIVNGSLWHAHIDVDLRPLIVANHAKVELRKKLSEGKRKQDIKFESFCK